MGDGRIARGRRRSWRHEGTRSSSGSSGDLGAMDVLVPSTSATGSASTGRSRTAGRLRPSGLAEAAGLHERYAREWLEQQAATGILEVDDAEAERERRFASPPGHDEALLDEPSLDYVAPFGRLVVASVRADRAAARGVPDRGRRSLRGLRRRTSSRGRPSFTRPMFTHLLGSKWLPAVPEVHERLLADPPARVADVACGCGLLEHRDRPRVSACTCGRHRPRRRRRSRRRARTSTGSGVEDRVTFHERDAADPTLAGRYDLVYDLRGAARHVVPRRRARGRARACSPRAAR